MNKKKIIIVVLLYSSNLLAQMNTHFVTTWKTNNEGLTGNRSIMLPVYADLLTGSSNGYVYNYDVDWNNDGVFDEFGLTGSVIHTFSSPGIYTIRIRGQFPRIYFQPRLPMEYLADNPKLIKVNQWGNQVWESMAYAFSDCVNLDGPSLDIPNLSIVTDMNFMFLNATKFNQDLSLWDTSHITSMKGTFCGAYRFNNNIGTWDTANVTDMSLMFFLALSFNQNISTWNTSSVVDMSHMFRIARSFNQDISPWNTANVADMSYMFQKAISFNQDISPWNTANVTDMSHMFEDATSFNQDISAWSTANVTDMSHMFEDATSFNQDISAWSTANVADMSYMFQNATSFNKDIGPWNTANVADMSHMFQNVSSFNQDISLWNTANVADMSYMFQNATSFNQDISLWNTANVTHMSYMFQNAISFDQDLGTWNISSLLFAVNMFKGVTLSTPNYESLLIGWQEQTHNNNVQFSGGNSKYCIAEAERSRGILIETDSWNIVDAGFDSLCAPIAPNFFTPNNDDYNDTWDVTDANGFVISISIYDRYGKFLMKILPNTTGWDGTYNSLELPGTDYWYVMNLLNGKQLRGHFTLKR